MQPVASARRKIQTEEAEPGMFTKIWVEGGKYRHLAEQAFNEEASVPSKIIGRLKVGELVLVYEVRNMDLSGGPGELLRVRVGVETGRLKGKLGWIDAINSQKEFTLDTRNHLDYENWMRNCGSQSYAHDIPGKDGQRIEFDIELHRPEGTPMGVHVDRSEGHWLRIESMVDGGAFMAWNAAHPDRAVRPRDRILQVDGEKGDADALIERLKTGGEFIKVRILRVLEEQEASGLEEEQMQWPPASSDLAGLVNSAEESANSLVAETTQTGRPELDLLRQDSQTSRKSSPERRRTGRRSASGRLEQSDEGATALATEPSAKAPTESASDLMERHRPSPVKEMHTSPVVCKPSPQEFGNSIRIAEDEPDWKPFYDAAGKDEGQDGGCCRETGCKEDGWLAMIFSPSFFGCGGKDAGFKAMDRPRPPAPSAGPLPSPIEPAPEPRPARGSPYVSESMLDFSVVKRDDQYSQDEDTAR